ncbi:MAG: hypothetical protein K6U08_07865 [Firmicutes bacterium]|nr:hypothetical protein [Bacillota bacterium]
MPTNGPSRRTAAAPSRPPLPPCPRCGSPNTELLTPKNQLPSAIGTILLGLVLCLAWAPLIFFLVPAGIYLIVSALVSKPTYSCLECRYRWPAGPDSEKQRRSGPRGDL